MREWEYVLLVMAIYFGIHFLIRTSKTLELGNSFERAKRERKMDER